LGGTLITSLIIGALILSRLCKYLSY